MTKTINTPAQNTESHTLVDPVTVEMVTWTAQADGRVLVSSCGEAGDHEEPVLVDVAKARQMYLDHLKCGWEVH